MPVSSEMSKLQGRTPEAKGRHLQAIRESTNAGRNYVAGATYVHRQHENRLGKRTGKPYPELLISDDVGCVETLWPLLAYKVDSISFIQGFEAVFLNC